MPVDESARSKAIAVIRNLETSERGAILKAIFDLRHNARSGDEALLYPLLEHEDDGIVASALYSLCEVYGHESQLQPLIRKWAWGDERDVEDMPIQCHALFFLARAAKKDSEAMAELWRIAESESTAPVPRARAWNLIAESLGTSWTQRDADEMIISPDSPMSEAIRARIRVAGGR